ncbi:hypothetical protein [Sporofaciens sp. JLR.KK001]|jgi:hypothetical protein|uniref:hypothetical protein n=1 Tax=Sporofaciens sp. JLR.KK001 TaxID=3112621 RepID=UPI002FF41085
MVDLENKNLNREGFTMMKRWLENRNAGKTFADFFHQYGYHSIAIYDAGEIGRILYDEIKGLDIEVKYFVDRNAQGMRTLDGIPVVLLRDIKEMAEVDALLVSPIVNCDVLCKVLSKEVPELSVLALRDAVYEF